MKKTVAVLMALTVMASLAFNAGAYALVEERGEAKAIKKGVNDIYFEDFSSYEEGGKPAGLKVTESTGQTVSITTLETPDSKSGSVLKFSDTGTASCSVGVPVPQISGAVTFEMRFKFRRTSTDGFGFIMNFTGPSGTNAFRVIKFSAENDTLCYVNNAGNNLFSRGINYHDEWFTMKIRWDNELRQTGILFSGASLATQKPDLGQYSNNAWFDKANKTIMVYSQPWFNEFTDDAVTNITLATYGSSAGDYFIDYMKFTRDVEEFKPVKERAGAKFPELLSDPAARLVPDRINVVFKGEVKYFGNPVKTVNSRTMVDARNFASWYGMKLTDNRDGSYVMSGEKGSIAFEKDCAEFKFNSTSLQTDTPPEIINKSVYIPLRSFAEAMGDTVSWSDELSCVTVE